MGDRDIVERALLSRVQYSTHWDGCADGDEPPHLFCAALAAYREKRERAALISEKWADAEHALNNYRDAAEDIPARERAAVVRALEEAAKREDDEAGYLREQHRLAGPSEAKDELRYMIRCRLDSAARLRRLAAEKGAT